MTSVMETRRTYNYGFGRVEAIVTTSAFVVDTWIEGILERHRPGRNLVVGLECKWWRDMMRNERMATLQLCVGSSCIIIQLVHMDHIPTSLFNFLGDHEVICVGVDVEHNVKKLKSEYGVYVPRTEDLCRLAEYFIPDKFRFWGHDLKSLAQGIVDFHMPEPKFVGRKDWRRSYLDDEEIEYACIDAYASYMVGMKFL